MITNRPRKMNTMDQKTDQRLNLLSEMMLLSDNALPTGGFSHSYGLETFIHQGESDLQGLLRTYILEELGKIDCPACALAYRAADAEDLSGLLELDRTINAMRIPREWREAGSQTGKRLAYVGETLNGRCPGRERSRLWETYRRMVKSGRTPGQTAVVAGVVYWLLNLPLTYGVLVYAVSALKNMVGAAVRLVPLGQTEGLKLQNALLPEVASMVKRAVMIKSVEDLGGFAPEFELAGIRHEQLYTRLFIS